MATLPSDPDRHADGPNGEPAGGAMRTLHRITLNLRTKILLASIVPAVLLLTLVLLIATWTMGNNLESESIARLEQETSATAERISKINKEGINNVRNMAQSQKPGVMFGDRAETVLFAKQMLENYDTFTGSCFCYDRNADGRDALYAEDSDANPPGSEFDVYAPNGRLIAYWARGEDGKPNAEPLLDVEPKPGEELNFVEPYYSRGTRQRFQLYKQGRSNVIYHLTEPYNYGGTLIVEYNWPLTVGGGNDAREKYVGLAGMDRGLGQIDELLEQTKRTALRNIYGEGNVPPEAADTDFMLISRQGGIVSTTLPDLSAIDDVDRTVNFAAPPGISVVNRKEVLSELYLQLMAVSEVPPQVNGNNNVERQLLPEVKLKPNAQPASLRAVDPVDGHEYIWTAAPIDIGDWLLVRRVDADLIDGPIAALQWQILGVSLMGLALMVSVLIFVVRKISERIEQGVDAAEQVAEGDLTVYVPSSSTGDETGKLLTAINTMTESLNTLLGRVKQGSRQLTRVASRISHTAEQQEQTVAEFGTSTNEIAAAGTEISATSQELARTMDEVTEVASQTASVANDGYSSLTQMQQSMGKLAEATGSISSKLAVINEKVSGINIVIETITKVTDQTHLLSMNAAIEAEKAGASGRGFRVVAREMRRLSDQTAIAAQDIEEIVKQMQQSVSAGVGEMDRFKEQVQESVQEAESVASQLTEIIQQVQGLTLRFEQVNEGMHSQTVGAQQISDAMSQLSDGAGKTDGALKDFKYATIELRDAVQSLEAEVSRFTVREDAGLSVEISEPSFS